MDSRYQQLEAWLTQTVPSQPQKKKNAKITITPVSGDASFRRYYRITQGARHWIAMDAPPEKEDCTPYLAIARFWRDKGINVPEIIAEDLTQGFLLISDFGDDLLLSHINRSECDADRADALYRACMDDLIKLQLSMQQGSTLLLPDYDAALLHREMALFSDWLCDRKLRAHLSPESRLLLLSTFQQLAKGALQQPRVPVHRDYHSRNIMVVGKEEVTLGHLDFQDAVMGPITYDLVSLLRDCYIQWPAEQVQQWLTYYYEQATERGLLATDMTTFTRWFDWMGMQRHLKAAGIFARLSLRDGKHGYLADIPRTVGYILEVASRYPELSAFHDWLIQQIKPLLAERLTPAPRACVAG